jgi:hypothetical protein
MAALLRRHWSGVASAATALVLGGSMFLVQGAPIIHAEGDRTPYTVGSVQGLVTSTTTPAARHIYIYRESDQKIIAVLRADKYGRFGTTLVPGEYAVMTHYRGLHEPGEPLPLLVEEGSTTQIVVDTGNL